MVTKRIAIIEYFKSSTLNCLLFLLTIIMISSESYFLGYYWNVRKHLVQNIVSHLSQPAQIFPQNIFSITWFSLSPLHKRSNADLCRFPANSNRNSSSVTSDRLSSTAFTQNYLNRNSKERYWALWSIVKFYYENSKNKQHKMRERATFCEEYTKQIRLI